MRSKAFAVLLLSSSLLLQQRGSAQDTVKNEEPAPSHQAVADQPPVAAEEPAIRDWLNAVDHTTERLVGFGVDREIAEGFAGPRRGEPVRNVQWTTFRGGTQSRLAIMFLPCTWVQRAYLYAVEQSSGVWRVTDRAVLDCHYDDKVSVEIDRIRDPSRDEIVVHHACAGHGAGYLEQDINIFTLSHGKLNLELETEEVLNVSRVGGPRHDLLQRSTFTIIPIFRSRSRAIEETRTCTLNDHSIVQRRIFRWDPTKGRYRPSAFTPVEASPTK
jgi:hypothetical protein